jgi:hypothetical protein
MAFVSSGELRVLTPSHTTRKALRVALEDFSSSVVAKAGSIIAI